MSIHENPDHDVPRFEPWLGVLLASMVPSVLLQFLPPQFLVPLIGISVLLLVTSLLLLRRQIVQRRAQRAMTGRPDRAEARSFDGASSTAEGVTS